VYVPDETTAVKIAIAVFTPIYGSKSVRQESPFHATLAGTRWLVTGTLPKSKRGFIAVGGTITAEIDRSTGRIEAVYHGK